MMPSRGISPFWQILGTVFYAYHFTAAIYKAKICSGNMKIDPYKNKERS